MLRKNEVVAGDPAWRLFLAWPSARNDGIGLSRSWIIGPPLGIGLVVTVGFLVTHYHFGIHFDILDSPIIYTILGYSVWVILRGTMGVTWVDSLLERSTEDTPKKTILHLWLAEWGTLILGPISLAGAGYIFFFGPRMGVTLAIGSLLPAGTIIYLALFTRYTARAFSNDMERQLTLSEGHWDSQAQLLSVAIGALNDSAKTQTRALNVAVDQTRILNDSIEALRGSLELQSQELNVARQALDLNRRLMEIEEARRRRLTPHLVIAMAIPTVALAIKHMVVRVHNTGMDGHGLVTVFGIQPDSLLQDQQARIDSQESAQFDFGDISGWPDMAALHVSCEVADNNGERYRFAGDFQYDRNVRGHHSEPIVTPAYLIPSPERIN